MKSDDRKIAYGIGLAELAKLNKKRGRYASFRCSNKVEFNQLRISNILHL